MVDVHAEEGGGEEGDDASSMRSSKSGGSRGKVDRPCKAPKLPAKSGGQPPAAKPLPATQAAAQVDAWVAAKAGAMPEWWKRAVAAEGEVLLLRQAPRGRAAGVGGGAARNGGGTGPGPSLGVGPQTQAEGGRAGAAARRADGRGGGRGGGGVVRSALWR